MKKDFNYFKKQFSDCMNWEVNNIEETWEELKKEFEVFLAGKFGMSKSPKRFKLFGLAWEYGYLSDGIDGVYQAYVDFAELLS